MALRFSITGATDGLGAGDASGQLFNAGLSVVTYVVSVLTDPAQNTASCSFSVTIADAEAPDIQCGAGTFLENDPGACSKLIADNTYDPVASDNCPGVIAMAHNYAPGPNPATLAGALFPVGTTPVLWTATDTAGNQSTCVQQVIIQDTEDPVFLNCPVQMVMVGNDPDQCEAKVNWSPPAAVDNCGVPAVMQTGGPVSGSVIPVNTLPLTITYTATDAEGNTSICTFEVLVVDTQNPELDDDILLPGNMTVECDAVPAPFVLTTDDVHDNCTPAAQLVIAYTQVRTDGSCGNNYVLTRTWTITDAAGNKRTHVQKITVRDTTKPVANCKAVTVTLDKSGNATITAAQVNNGSTDNCTAAANLTLSVTPSTFDCSKLGANTVTLTVTDQCGNSSTCTATVTVQQGIGSCTPQFSAATTCMNNATPAGNDGQFLDVITVKAISGQTWTLTANPGLFSTNSAAPPIAPAGLPAGTAFTMGSADGLDNDGAARWTPGLLAAWWFPRLISRWCAPPTPT